MGKLDYCAEDILQEIIGEALMTKRNPGLWFDMGRALENGNVFVPGKENRKAALICYAFAAKGGNAAVWNNIGWLISDEGKAICCYKKAAASGFNTTAMVNLGNIYENRIPEDKAAARKAYRWYKRAADHNDPKGMYNLANCLHFGWGVKQNPRKAYKIFKRLYNAGYSGTAFYMGLYKEEGLAGKKNYKKARHFYEVGAQQEDAYSFTHLARMYAVGHGVKKDETKALKLYLKAALLGDSLACTNIGCMYETGAGMKEKDLEEARKWYCKAAGEGEEHAIKALRRLNKKLKKKQREDSHV